MRCRARRRKVCIYLSHSQGLHSIQFGWRRILCRRISSLDRCSLTCEDNTSFCDCIEFQRQPDCPCVLACDLARTAEQVKGPARLLVPSASRVCRLRWPCVIAESASSPQTVPGTTACRAGLGRLISCPSCTPDERPRSAVNSCPDIGSTMALRGLSARRREEGAPMLSGSSSPGAAGRLGELPYISSMKLLNWASNLPGAFFTIPIK